MRQDKKCEKKCSTRKPISETVETKTSGGYNFKLFADMHCNEGEDMAVMLR